MVVLFSDLFVVLYTIYNDVFSATYRRLYDVAVTTFLATLTSSNTIYKWPGDTGGRPLHILYIYTALLFDTGCRLVRHVGRLYTFTLHNKF
jgi:hypothetical protein